MVKVSIRQESMHIRMPGLSLKAPGDTSNYKYMEFLLGSKGCMKLERNIQAWSPTIIYLQAHMLLKN